MKNKALLELRAKSVNGLKQNVLNDLNKSQTQTVKGEVRSVVLKRSALNSYSGAPYPYRKLKETHELIFSWLSWLGQR